MPVYKDKKRDTWYTSFYYVDWTGTRKRKKKEGFRTQKEAKAFEQDFLNKAHASCDMLSLYKILCKLINSSFLRQ